VFIDQKIASSRLYAQETVPGLSRFDVEQLTSRLRRSGSLSNIDYNTQGAGTAGCCSAEPLSKRIQECSRQPARVPLWITERAGLRRRAGVDTWSVMIQRVSALK